MKRTINRPHSTKAGLYQTKTVTTPINVETDPKIIGKPIAEAMRDAVEAGIRNVSVEAKSGRKRWNRTGKLASGMRVEPLGAGYVIVPPDDRLVSDPEMVSMLIEDIGAPAQRPLDEPTVKTAIAKTTRASVTKGSGNR